MAFTITASHFVLARPNLGSKNFETSFEVQSELLKLCPWIAVWYANVASFAANFKCYNLPATIARELFKPSTDSTSLLVSIKKNFLIWMGGFLLVTSQRRRVFEFLNHFNQLWAPIQWAIFWLKLFVETKRSNASIEPLIDLVACLEPKLWPKNPIVTQNQKIAECIESPNGGISNSDNSPLEHARELFETSKDSWSLVVCTEKKTMRFWVRGFQWVSLERRVAFAFFGCSIMTSSPGQWAEIVAQSLVVF